MRQKTLICDIDNTILNTRPRVRRCLEAMGRGEVFEQSPRTYGGFTEMLSKEEVQCFFDLFLSNEFLSYDRPLPDAAETLHDWLNAGQRLIYITGRHDVADDSMRAGTANWLKAHDYPVPDGHDLELIMKPDRFAHDLGYKQEILTRLKPFPENSVGLGDLPHEGPMYAEAGLTPILISTVGLFPEEELKNGHPEVVVASTWKAVAEHLCRTRSKTLD